MTNLNMNSQECIPRQFMQGIHAERNLFNGKLFFSAFLHINIVYGMDPAQLLHVVVKEAGKYLVTNPKTGFYIMLPINLYSK